jgi:hypothetical protein
MTKTQLHKLHASDAAHAFAALPKADASMPIPGAYDGASERNVSGCTVAAAQQYRVTEIRKRLSPLTTHNAGHGGERERRLGATCYDPGAVAFCRELIKLAGLTSIRLQLFPEQ